MTNFQFPNNLNNFDSKFSKYYLTISLVTFCFCLVSYSWSLPSFVNGQDSTGSSAPTIDPEIQQKVEERIQKVLTAQSEEKLAYVGKISDINEFIKIETREGAKQIKTDEETDFIGLNKKPIEKEDLEIGGYIIAMGYLDQAGALEARRIVETKEPKLPNLAVIYGEVTDMTSDSENILTVNQPKKGKPYELEATSKTTISQKVDDTLEKIKFEDIKIGDRLVAVGTLDEKTNLLTAKLIQIFPATPQAQTPSNKETLSPSPKITLTPAVEE